MFLRLMIKAGFPETFGLPIRCVLKRSAHAGNDADHHSPSNEEPGLGGCKKREKRQVRAQIQRDGVLWAWLLRLPVSVSVESKYSGLSPSVIRRSQFGVQE